jgi:hypothetical protein
MHKMTPSQFTHFANVRDALHIAGYDVPRTNPQNPVFKIDGRTYKTYASFMRAANKIAWTLI